MMNLWFHMFSVYCMCLLPFHTKSYTTVKTIFLRKVHHISTRSQSLLSQNYGISQHLGSNNPVATLKSFRDNYGSNAMVGDHGPTISSIPFIAASVLTIPRQAGATSTASIRKSSLLSFFSSMMSGGFSFDIQKVGDIRNNPYGLLLNILSTTLFIILPFTIFGIILQRRFTNKYLSRMEREVRREREYRENMYFEAVEGILNRLEDPDLSPKEKKVLLLDLKELDPKGKIRSFLGGSIDRRPDISDSLSPKKKK